MIETYKTEVLNVNVSLSNFLTVLQQRNCTYICTLLQTGMLQKYISYE